MIIWSAPPAQLTLTRTVVALWRAKLNVSPDRLESLHRLLSGDEQQRANEFLRESDKHFFIAGRGTLRVILGRYLGVHPAEVCFAYGGHGKPILAGNSPNLTFNLAHSHGLACYAISYGRELGVDIEQYRPLAGLMRIAQRFFSPQEYERLIQQNPEEQLEMFFTGWTKKEALLKALGTGLVLPLPEGEAFLEADPRYFVRLPADTTRCWSLRILDIGSGYHGALVVEGTEWSLYYYELD